MEIPVLQGEESMDNSRRLIIRWLVGVSIFVTSLVTGNVARAQDNIRIRWDIISVDFSTIPPTTREGGIASARAQDGSKITLTGQGLFNSFDPTDVTGGGQWTTFNPKGEPTDSGDYQVVGLVSFIGGPGRTGTIDTIGDPADSRAGLAILRISYADGSRGTLTVSCHLQGTPDSVFEGVTASKSFLDYWNREPDVPNVDANRTIFHVVP
jgi:hypothetical protein